MTSLTAMLAHTDLLAILLIGHSLIAVLILAFGHFRAGNYAGQPASRLLGWGLLTALATLQLCHLAWLAYGEAWTDNIVYRLALFGVAPAFYLFSRGILQDAANDQHPAQLAHAAPLLAAMLLPTAQALALAFAIGCGYLLWLARSLLALRHVREHFRLEILLLGSAVLIAVMVAVLGLLQASLPGKLFYSLYACAIGLALLLVQLALLLRPHLGEEVSQSARSSYSQSTLGNVDCTAALARLAALMQERRLYLDAELDLAGLATELGLSTHQLSELLNQQLGKSFARYLREWRVTAAQQMLLAEPAASVLSVGLSVGFTSQSTFYEAFREICGTTPGQYRKLQDNQKN